jgi:hypothetical protein
MGKNYNKFINYGLIGAGNQYILHKLTESHAINEITVNDTVAIMWSFTNRYDSIFKGKWNPTGNVFKSNRPPEFLDMLDPVGFEIRDCAFIHAAKTILDSIGCRYVFFSLDDMYSHAPFEKTINTILPSTMEVLFKGDFYNRIDDLIHSPDDYETFSGADWPTLQEFKEYYISSEIPYILPEIKKEICEKFNAKNFQEVIDKKMWSCPDFHPTTEMHLEYLDAVLPDWRTWH